MSDIQYTRQLGFFNPAEHPNASATVIGLGGIGSFAALSLAKLGVPHLQLIDFDFVEPHNVPNQLYTKNHIGLPKAHAMSDTCLSFGDVEVTPIAASFGSAVLDDVYVDSPLTISGLDSMAARMDIWRHIKHNPRIKTYIDARIAGQLIVIYTVNPTNIDSVDAYEATLHSDDEALPAACTERGVIDVGMAVGSLITRLARAFYANDNIDPVTVLNNQSLTLTHGDWVPTT